jgi:signal transduction histidine kinase
MIYVHISLNSLEVLKEAKLLWASQMACECTIEIDPLAEEVVFTSDERLLGRVIGNMVKNALEASRSGDTVTLDCRMVGENIAFSVHNPACMPRNVQMQVFQRSFSTKGEGHGLGAYSMRLLSERYLGGKVSFTTSEEGGTTFTARYPIALPSTTPPEEEARFARGRTPMVS